VRVPAIIVSPFIERGTVDLTIYEHASVPAIVKKIFGLPAFLTKRDAAANTFESVLSRETPRTDAPRKLPVPRGPGRVSEQRALLHTPVPLTEVQPRARVRAAAEEPLSEFQEGLLTLADMLEGAPEDAGLPRALTPLERQTMSEEEAAVHVRLRIGSFIAR
jgi:phospholipase C